MVDPQCKGKVRQRLRTTLVEAEKRATEAAETISCQSVKLADFIARRRNGRARVESS